MGAPVDQWGSLRCPIGSMATLDGSSDHRQGTAGDLKDSVGSRGMFRGPRGSRGALRGSEGVNRYVEGIPWGHGVCLMSFLMIHMNDHKACMPAYK